MEILFIAVLCLVGGFYMGRMTAPEAGTGDGAKAGAAEDGAETERLRQEQRAFSMLMGYSADVAYGARAAFEREA